MTKLCKDCKYCAPAREFSEQTFWLQKKLTNSSWKYAKCGHPNADKKGQPYWLVTDMVETTATEACVQMRQDFGESLKQCGPDARWFEARYRFAHTLSR